MHSYPKLLMRSLATLMLVGGLFPLLSCGNNYYNYYNPPTGPSNYKHKMYVSNAFSGQITIVNAENDEVFGRTISTAGTSANTSMLRLSPDKTKTLSYNSGTIYVIDNTIDDILANSSAISLGGTAQSIVLQSDNQTGLAAIRNLTLGANPKGGVEVFNYSTFAVTQSISVPEVTQLVITHTGDKVLAFSDNTNTFTFIDPSNSYATTTISGPGLDRPVNAVFSSDDSKAYILNCGAECGGTAASVSVFDMSTKTITSTTPVSAATVGFLDTNGKLYVAGTVGTAGALSVLDAGSLAPPSTTFPISNGYHRVMGLSNNGHLYIGSTGCSNASVNGVVQGCLSMFDTSSQSVNISTNPGDVAAIAPVAGRNVVYVCQNGELVIYDSTTDKPQASQIDIVGSAGDVIQVK